MLYKNIKIGIIGVGHVGAHVALSLVSQGLCRQLVLVDIDRAKAESNSIDLFDALPNLGQNVTVYAGGYEDLADADFVVMSACSALLEEDRLRELDGTLDVMDEILPQLMACKFSGKIISISNPCDLVAQYIWQRTGLHTIGTGTLLDTARMHSRVAQALNVAPCSIGGFSLGEHGNSQMVAWSTVTVEGLPALPILTQRGFSPDMLSAQINGAGWDIVRGKGCTEFGIAAATATLIKAIITDSKAVLPCSTFLPDYGIYASLPCVIGKKGVEGIITPSLAADEQALFDASCGVLQKHFEKISNRAKI